MPQVDRAAQPHRLYVLSPGSRTTGRITLWGKDIYDRDVDPILVRRAIGMVFQKPNPFLKSMYGNVAYGARRGLPHRPVRLIS